MIIKCNWNVEPFWFKLNTLWFYFKSDKLRFELESDVEFYFNNYNFLYQFQ